jgi:hypothetical protein
VFAWKYEWRALHGRVNVAESTNPTKAKAALLKIGLVAPLAPDSSNDDGFVAYQYIYQ